MESGHGGGDVVREGEASFGRSGENAPYCEPTFAAFYENTTT
jgi:hypothetical protein